MSNAKLADKFVAPLPPDLGRQHVLGDAEFAFFRTLILERAGISLSDVKRELVQSRLRARVTELKLKGFREYREFLESESASSPEWQEFVNCLTTNKTDFFREPHHFDFLKGDFLQEWRKRRANKNLRVWSAASSTGEEPYTISMVLDRSMQSDETYSIRATDIDTEVIEKARAAVYPRDRLEGIVPPEYRTGYQLGTGDISRWARISPRVKDRVQFGLFNLITDRATPGERYDIVFCRNVLIYFKPETILKVVETLYDATEVGGYLLIGHSETLNNLSSRWVYVGPSIYRRVR